MYTSYAPQTKKTLNITITPIPGAPLDTLEVPNTSKVPNGKTGAFIRQQVISYK